VTRRLTGKSPIAFGAALGIALSRALAAQSDVATIRLVPPSGLTLHVRTLQSYDTVTTPREPGADPIVNHGESMSAYTEVVGPSSSEHEYGARLTFESAPEPLRPLAGTPIDAVFDERGRLERMTLPPPFANDGDRMKPLVAAFVAENWLQGWPPAVTLRVGASAAVPAAIQLAMPGTASGVAVSGGRTLTLRSIDRDGPDRIAVLEQTVGVSMSDTMTGGASPSIDVSGSGTIEWNLDRGYARSIDLEMTLDFTGPAARTNGTERVHVTAAAP